MPKSGNRNHMYNRYIVKWKMFITLKDTRACMKRKTKQVDSEWRFFKSFFILKNNASYWKSLCFCQSTAKYPCL